MRERLLLFLLLLLFFLWEREVERERLRRERLFRLLLLLLLRDFLPFFDFLWLPFESFFSTWKVGCKRGNISKKTPFQGIESRM